MIFTHNDQITIERITSLVVDKVPESSSLEYKRDLQISTDSDKKEFLADICSFTNSGGGTIIYGIDEVRDDKGKTTGIPGSVIGMDVANTDELTRRLDESIRNGLQPSLFGIKIKILKTTENKTLLSILVPRSYQSPHMVVFQNSSRFYGRANASKYQMGIQEIKAAFLGSDEIPARVNKFRLERVSAIRANETPYPLASKPRLVLHFVPVSAVAGYPTFNFNDFFENGKDEIRPLSHHGHAGTINFDGFCSYYYHQEAGKKTYYSYTQVFRNGAFESVDTSNFWETDKQKNIPIDEWESDLRDTLNKNLKCLSRYELAGSAFVMISVLDAIGYEIPSNSMLPPHMRENLKISNKDLLFSPQFFEDISTVDTSTLIPSFELIWNAFGKIRKNKKDSEY